MIQNKKLVILGAGTAGIMLANKLSKKPGLDIVVVDASPLHYYQPAFLFYPFGKYSPEQISKPTASLLKKRVKLVAKNAAKILSDENSIILTDGSRLDYDVLVIATGTRVDPSETEGLMGEGWRKNVFDYYSLDGTKALRDALVNFKGGKLVVQIQEMPIKCPVAPLEFSFLSDDFFKKRGLRDKIEITYVTPLSGAFTKPVASAKLGHLLKEKNINLVTDFYVEKVDEVEKKLYCYDERTVDYDLLVTIPLNVGADVVKESGLANDVGFVEVDPGTLQSRKKPNVFAVGDATDVATSKAGSVAHFEVDSLQKNVMSYLADMPLAEKFDGHSNCFVEMGDGKALLLDFNYDTEPLEGKFPFPIIGPMKLLNPSRINHIGKLVFRYIYWYMLLPGRKIPFIPAHMKMSGKKIVKS